MEKVRTLDEIIEIATRIAKGTGLTEDQTQDLYVYCIEKFNIGKLQNKTLYQSIYNAAKIIKRNYNKKEVEDNELLNIDNIICLIDLDYIVAKDIIEELLDSRLTEREKEILYKIFFEDKTLSQVSKEYRLTPERIRQIKMKSIRKLRRPDCLNKLSDLYGLTRD